MVCKALINKLTFLCELFLILEKISSDG